MRVKTRVHLVLKELESENKNGKRLEWFRLVLEKSQKEWNTSGVSFFECKHVRECVKLLLLIIFLHVRIKSSIEESASKDVDAGGAFTMQAIHQQFE